MEGLLRHILLMKSYKNNNKKTNFYYYRDSDQKEIDLIILEKGVLHFVECKFSVSYNVKDIEAFNTLRKTTNYIVGKSCIICNIEKIYSIKEDVFVLPITAI